MGEKEGEAALDKLEQVKKMGLPDEAAYCVMLPQELMQCNVVVCVCCLFPALLVFFILVPLRIDGTVTRTWVATLTPLWVFAGCLLLMILSVYPVRPIACLLSGRFSRCLTTALPHAMLTP